MDISGRRRSLFDYAFADLDHGPFLDLIRDIQFVQDRPGFLRVRIVASPGADKEARSSAPSNETCRMARLRVRVCRADRTKPERQAEVLRQLPVTRLPGGRSADVDEEVNMLDLTSHSYPAEYDELRRRGVPGIDIERLTFSIMHGNGNIILVVDEALSGLSGRELGGDLARELCGSFLSIRVDGVAFVRTATEPVRMTYFERDGTHSQMCGNALRCVTRYGTEQGYLRADADVVMTDDGPKRVSAAGGRVQAALGAGREFQQVAPDRYFVFSGLAHLVLLLTSTTT